MRTFIHLRAAVAAALLLVIIPVTLPARAQEAAPEASEGDNLLAQYLEALNAGEYRKALDLVPTIDTSRADREQRAFLLAMRAVPLIGLGKKKEADKLIAAIDDLNPDEPFSQYLLFEGALMAQDIALAGKRLDKMIARYPDAVRELKPEQIGFILRSDSGENPARNVERQIDLARIGFAADSETGEQLAFSALVALAKRGDFVAADSFIDDVRKPLLYERLLIQRRYAPLWGHIATIAGPQLGRARESYVTRAKQRFEREPDNADALQAYVNALRFAGRPAEAVALKTYLPADSAAMAKADQKMGWAVNNVALAAHEAGLAAEADALFALLNDAPMPKEYWRVNMKINRLELLVQDGKFALAQPLIEATASVEMSPYAEQLIRRLRYCTASGLGRTDQVKRLLPELLAHAADAPAPTVDALLCAGDLDRAETLTLSLLKDKPTFEDDFVHGLQVVPLTTDDPSIWRDRWRELRARPAIRAEFDRLGRDMPSEFLLGQTAEKNAQIN